jgi:NADPH-dependent curcumin reductase CurA
MSANLIPTATRVRLAKIPSGLPVAETWSWTHEAARAPVDGEVTLRVKYISVDPAMSSWIQPVRSYSQAVPVGDVMRAFGIGQVVASRSEKLAAGDHVFTFTGVQTDVTLPARGLRKLDPNLAPLPKFMSGLGWTGFTGYFGMTDIGQPKEGETVVVSAAAGAVGSVAAQVARLKGAKVIGIAGGAEKCGYLTGELKLDGAIDYKSADVGEALTRLAPDGIDVYFDNVGGDILDAVLARIKRHARVVLCGGISQYGDLRQARGPANYLQLVAQSGTMRGFTMLDYLPRIPEAGMALGGWMMQGELKTREHIVKGIERFPEALAMLFAGKNHGKLIIEL